MVEQYTATVVNGVASVTLDTSVMNSGDYTVTTNYLENTHFKSGTVVSDLIIEDSSEDLYIDDYSYDSSNGSLDIVLGGNIFTEIFNEYVFPDLSPHFIRTHCIAIYIVISWEYGAVIYYPYFEQNTDSLRDSQDRIATRPIVDNQDETTEEPPLGVEVTTQEGTMFLSIEGLPDYDDADLGFHIGMLTQDYDGEIHEVMTDNYLDVL